MHTDRDRQLEELTDAVNRCSARVSVLVASTTELCKLLKEIFSGVRTVPDKKRRWPWS